MLKLPHFKLILTEFEQNYRGSLKHEVGLIIIDIFENTLFNNWY